MEIKCGNCNHWITKRIRVYDDGSEVVDFQAPDRGGECNVLSVRTTADFYCAKFETVIGDHIVRIAISGTPWQNFKMIPCPDCKGRGCGEHGGVCGRCVGTANVRQYDDGFIGEEKTRRHPNDPTPEQLAVMETVVPPSPSVPT